MKESKLLSDVLTITAVLSVLKFLASSRSYLSKYHISIPPGKILYLGRV